MNLRDVITEQVLADYLTADFGHDLAIWDDGSYEIIESNLRWRHNDNAPCVRAECPGINNLDSTCFSDGYAECDNGTYYEIETGREIGNLADLIHESCREGDVSVLLDELIEKCEAAYID